MEPSEIGLDALPERLRFSRPDNRHALHSVSDREEKKYVEGSGIVILEWNHKPEADFQLDGCSKEIEFDLPGSFWQVYVLEDVVRLHFEDLIELSRDKQETAELRNYFLSDATLLFDYKLPHEAQTAAQLDELLSKCGPAADKESLAVVVAVPLDDGSTEFFFVESIEILNQQEGNKFARQPVLVVNTFDLPGWEAFDYPSAWPRNLDIREKDNRFTPQITQPGITSHSSKPKTKPLKMSDPLF